MRRGSQTPVPLEDVALGDVVTLHDGRSLTVRSSVVLPQPIGSLSSFLLAGELDVILAVGPGQVSVYCPVEFATPASNDYTIVCEGAASYYAPHVPALAGAMGEVQFRLVMLRGSVDPLILLWRENELIVFKRETYTSRDAIEVLPMRRGDTRSAVPLVRHAASVEPAAGQALPAAGGAARLSTVEPVGGRDEELSGVERLLARMLGRG